MILSSMRRRTEQRAAGIAAGPYISGTGTSGPAGDKGRSGTMTAP